MDAITLHDGSRALNFGGLVVPLRGLVAVEVRRVTSGGRHRFHTMPVGYGPTDAVAEVVISTRSVIVCACLSDDLLKLLEASCTEMRRLETRDDALCVYVHADAVDESCVLMHDASREAVRDILGVECKGHTHKVRV